MYKVSGRDTGTGLRWNTGMRETGGWENRLEFLAWIWKELMVSETWKVHRERTWGRVSHRVLDVTRVRCLADLPERMLDKLSELCM